jgi:hypothetical protein
VDLRRLELGQHASGFGKLGHEVLDVRKGPLHKLDFLRAGATGFLSIHMSVDSQMND